MSTQTEEASASPERRPTRTAVPAAPYIFFALILLGMVAVGVAFARM